MKPKYTAKDLRKQFPNDEICLDYIYRNLYADYACPACGRKDLYRVKGRKCWACQCGHQLHPLAGTIFHKSSTSLVDWFLAIFLMSTSRNGVAALELQRQIGVTYKTAWRMQKQIRSLMKQGGNPLSGIVEVDETYVGGKAKGKGGGKYAGGKIPVVGAVERGSGEVKAEVVTDTKASTLVPFVQRNVAVGTHVMTDEWRAYRQPRKAGYKHSVVNHSKKQYVRGKVHTNTIEGFWSQFKRSIGGTYHAVSRKHLQTYVDEFAFRYQHRASDAPMFQHLLRRVVSRKAA